MLTHSQISILKFLSACKNGSASYTALSDKFGPSLNFNLSRLIMSGDVSCNKHPQFVPSEIFLLTSKGYQALDEHALAVKRQRKQNAENQEKARADALKSEENEKKSFRRELLIAIISGIAVLAVEHCVEIMDFITELINRFLSFLH